jgi:serine/threonine protein kinase
MSPERFQQVEKIYHAARELEPSQRSAYLARACNGDEELRRELESLLAQEPAREGMLDRPAAGLLNDSGVKLAAGAQLGPYKIEAPIGAGGMGEVYRARDTKLKRDVALKVVAEAFARDPERMARFQREAEVLAALNHPNIAQIYGVAEAGGVRALVMELVEGESPKGPMAFDEAWKVASQMAAGLEYAHERGIVHRDLKPANVKVTGDGLVKLLDFGLAKAFTGQTADSGNPDNSPTLTLGATQLGVILGTAAYMAPEQAKGKTVDKRADIWSFGVVLYELLTGERLFTGDGVSDTVAQVLTKQPDLAKVPMQARRLLRECLQKDPKDRLRDIGDAKRQLVEETPGAVRPTGGSASRSWSERAGWVVAMVAAGLAAVVSGLHFREQPPVGEVMRFQIPPPGQSDFASNSAILSPDGRRLAFLAPGPNSTRQIWVHSFDSLAARPLSGTENPSAGFFWSPDSRYLAFAAQGKLKKIEVSGGHPQTVSELGGSWRSGDWSPKGVIVFGTGSRGLMRVAEPGGIAVPLTTLDSARGEDAHISPTFLPDGKHLLYMATSTRQAAYSVYVGSLDLPPGEQSRKRLMFVDAGSSYAPALNPKNSRSPGFLLFTWEGSLMAQPFDPGRLVLAGDAVPVAEGLSRGTPPPFSVSRTGVLAYRTDTAEILRLTWFNRDGKTLGTAGEPGDYNTVSLSPDGDRVAVSRTGASGDIWLHEFARVLSTRLTFAPALYGLPIWSPKGDRIIFSSSREGGINLYQKAASGAGAEEAFYKSNELKLANDWSRDGRFLLYSTGAVGEGRDLWYLPLEGERKPVPYLRTEFNESQGRFSPDSRFIAYTSNASGREEIYVQPFPAAASDKWQVSKGGGVEPRWRADGKELFYISTDSEMMAVAVSTNPTFTATAPKVLFHVPSSRGGSLTLVTRYDVTADGQKFLVNALPSQGAGKNVTPITVVFNWQAGLKK